MKEKIIDIFRNQANLHPDKLALIYEGTQLTYRQLEKEVDCLSRALYEKGVVRGDKVGVLLPNCREFVVLMLSAANLGMTLVPQNTTLSSNMLRNTFKATDVKHIICWYSIIPDIKESFDKDLKIECWVAVGGIADDVYNYDELKDEYQGQEVLEYNASVSDLYILTLTSGSTGEPKPIMLLQETKIKRVESAVESYNISGEDVVLAATPLYHSLAERLVLLPLLMGGTSVLMAGFTAKEWVDEISINKVTFTMAVASQLKQVYNYISTDMSNDLFSLRCLVSSSELLDNILKEDLIKLFDCDFHECYGASEVACVTDISIEECERKAFSVGKSLNGVDLKILKADENIFAETGEVGEIICKSPLAFAGYYNSPLEMQNCMWNGYFKTGDLGKLDEDGYLYFQGRKKEIIITGGINVYPKDIENVLNSHDDILESAVIPTDDSRLGEQVTAIIVRKNENLSMRQIQRLCAKELADFQQPRRIIFIDKLPRNHVGKVAKKDLINMYNKCEEK